MSKYGVVKSVSFSKIKASNVSILEYLEANDIDFNTETKKMWMEKIGIKEEEKKPRIEILRERLKNKKLCREQVFRINREIKKLEELNK